MYQHTKSAKDFLASLRDNELRRLAEVLIINCTRARVLPLMHTIFLRKELRESREQKTLTDVIAEGKFGYPIVSEAGFHPGIVAEVNRRLDADDEETVDEFFEQGVAAADDLWRKAHPFYGPWLINLKHAAIIGIWSTFEVVTSDVWVYSLNSRPELFAMKVLAKMGEDINAEGIGARSIKLGLAAKYEFNLRSHIGTILFEGLDFTKLSDIKKAYVAAFDIDEGAAKAIESDVLRQLILDRNLVAHRGGIVDEIYVRKAGSNLAIGQAIEPAEKTINSYSDAVLETGALLVKLADRALV
jgi:hypothetical protein